MALWWVVAYMLNGDTWMREIRGARRAQGWLNTMILAGHTCVMWRDWKYRENERSMDFEGMYWSTGGPYFPPPDLDLHAGYEENAGWIVQYLDQTVEVLQHYDNFWWTKVVVTTFVEVHGEV